MGLVRSIAGRHPLKQGLKHPQHKNILHPIFPIAGRHPLKQGLKLQYPKIGGMGGRGFGMIKMDYTIDGTAVKKYETWVSENVEQIKIYLMGLGNL